MFRVHIDTDFGGDPDDLCALVTMLGWPDIQVTGITTTQDHDGQRAGYVRHVLRMLGQEDIPVASGARASMTTRQVAEPFPPGSAYWPEPVEPALSEPTDAMDLIERSIRGGATIACLGPVTNIAMFETFRGGMLKERRVVVMGGFIEGPGDGFPQSGPEHDWNAQWDTRATETVLNAQTHLTLVPYPVGMQAPLTEGDLREIEDNGPIGELIARQSRAWAAEKGMGEIGREHPGLPDDLVNFHYDPVAAAVAIDWARARREEVRLMPYVENGVLTLEPSEEGREIELVTDIDGEGFRELFLDCVTNVEAFARTRRPIS